MKIISTNLYTYAAYSLYLISTAFAECNGGASLCGLLYSEITHLVTHDSYALSPNLAATQDNTIVDQLNEGVRGIKLSAVPSLNDPSVINLCHTHCSVLDAGTVTETLNNITHWLEKNPKEVVTIMWNNLYNYKATELAVPYEESNIMPFVYTQETPNKWPTIQEMIDSGKRVVNFVDAEADPDHVPWLMDQFTRVFETPYENTDANGFDCKVDRIGYQQSPDDLIYVMNHFLYGVIELGSLNIEVPVRDEAEFINSESLLQEHIAKCTDELNKKPTFIEVDFSTIGDAFKVLAALNNVTIPDAKSKKKKTRPLALPLPSNFTSVRRANLSPTEHVIIDNSSTSNACYLKPRMFVLAISIIFTCFAKLI